MSTIIVFFLALLQLTALVVGYFAPYPELYLFVVLDGSPVFLIRALLDESLSADHHFTPLIVLYHALKYICLCRSQFTEYRYLMHYSALFMEIAYLVTCAQYV